MSLIEHVRAESKGNFCVSVGDGAYSEGEFAVALGNNVRNTTSRSVMIGAPLTFSEIGYDDSQKQRLRDWWAASDYWKAHMEANIGPDWKKAEAWMDAFMKSE